MPLSHHSSGTSFNLERSSSASILHHCSQHLVLPLRLRSLQLTLCAFLLLVYEAPELVASLPAKVDIERSAICKNAGTQNGKAAFLLLICRDEPLATTLRRHESLRQHDQP